MLEAGERRPEAVQAAWRGIASPKVLEDVMTAAEQLLREGEDRGLLLGQRRTLLRLMRTRFGQVPYEVEHAGHAGGRGTLDVWADRVPSASSTHEVVKVETSSRPVVDQQDWLTPNGSLALEPP